MYYLLVTLAIAASLAVSSIVGEIGQEYVANYFIENEAEDMGLHDPKFTRAAMAGSPDVLATDSRTRVGPVVPILVASLDAGNLPTASVERSGLGATAGLVIPAVDADEASLKPSPAAGARNPAAADMPAIAKASEAGAGPPAGAQGQLLLDLARDTPHRRPDGTAFLPIATQRIFSMRWQVSRRTDVPMAYEIPGHVITDPGTGTSVVAMHTGTVEAGPGGFPYLGMQVRSGDLLAYLQPTMSIAEQTQIEARIQQLVNLISLTEKQIERLKEVLLVRYRANKIEALKVQLEGNRRELRTLQSSLGRREALRATADGVISHIDAVVSGIVPQGQVVFEIVNPRALWVEAAAYDPAIAANIRSASGLTSDGQVIDLEFVGGGLVLSNQAIPLRFRVLDAPDGLSVGKPVTVIVRKNETIAGIPVPTSSIIRDGDGRSIVWERLSAETFAPRPVRATRVAGDVMVVESELSDGAQIVISGASILNQVR